MTLVKSYGLARISITRASIAISNASATRLDGQYGQS
jgi:hypothetical protein